MALQEGIYHAPGRRPGRHFALLFLRAAPDVDAAGAAAALGDLWGMYQGLKAGPRPRPRRRRRCPAATSRSCSASGATRSSSRAPRCRARAGSPTSTCSAPRTRRAAVRCCAARACATRPTCARTWRPRPSACRSSPNSKLAVDRAVVETWKALADAGRARARADDVLPRQPARRPPQLDRLPRRPLEPAQRGSRERHRDRPRHRRELGRRRDVPRVPAPGRRPRRLAAPVRAPSRSSPSGATSSAGCPIVGLGDGRRAADRPRLPGRRARRSTRRRTTRRSPSRRRSPIRSCGRATSSAPTTTSARRATSARGGSSARATSSSNGRTTPPGFRAGLNFVSFQDTPSRLLKMLTAGGWLGGANFGGDEERAARAREPAERLRRGRVLRAAGRRGRAVSGRRGARRRRRGAGSRHRRRGRTPGLAPADELVDVVAALLRLPPVEQVVGALPDPLVLRLL